MIDPIQISGATKIPPKALKKNKTEKKEENVTNFNQQYIEKFENSVSFKINLWDT